MVFKVSHIVIKGLNFMIYSFSGQVVFCFAIPEPYLLMLAKTDCPGILIFFSLIIFFHN